MLNNAYAFDYGLAIKDRVIIFDPRVTVPTSEIGFFGYYKSVSVRGDEYEISEIEQNQEPVDVAILLLRRGDVVHGHWILEVIPRLRLGLEVAPAAKVVVSSDIRAYQIEMLEALGVDANRLIRLSQGEAIFCKTLVIPSVAHTNQLYLSSHANETYNQLSGYALNKSRSYGHQRIFVTRKSRTNDPRMAYNCHEIETIARQEGYWVIDPGEAAWIDQIAVFHSAEKIVGLAGSGLHNTVFSGSKAHVMAIQSDLNGNYVQTSIAAIRGHRISYFVADSASGFIEDSAETGFLVDDQLFRMALQRMV